MNPKYLDEWKYAYQERLGIDAGDAEPTREQLDAAKQFADEHVNRLEKIEKKESQ